VLTRRAGDVAAAERTRALREFDDGAFEDTAAARRALSTMAVRVAVQTIAPAVAAARTSDRAGETVSDLFVEE
jgi:hypothetical protein